MLLSFAEDTHNDIKLLVCKNLLGILIEFRTIKDNYVLNRIVTTFEIQARNNYIKQSIHNIIYKLIDNDIYVNEFLPIIIDTNHIRVLLKDDKHSDVVIDNMEDRFYKKDSFKCRNNLLKLIRGIKCKRLFDFYNLLNIGDNYKKIERESIIKSIIDGLILNYQEGKEINKYFINHIKNTGNIEISIMELLFKIKDESIEGVLMKMIRKNLTRSQEQKLILMISDNFFRKRKEFMLKLLEHSIFRSEMFITALIKVLYSFKINLYDSFIVYFFKDHYQPIVGKVIDEYDTVKHFDSFDDVVINLLE
ncbi:hypothetical protein A0H76_2370 [Hepatospora eriocheir]|uniref:Uncharacterized protein n=1 Tax=Hepatospora eriocheir TaxID=1081669 RepID=A0A1X0QFK4_9MICR|nr:hypothetical protein A0H76_2370 [Hepatospora eriocheir]